MNVYIRDTAAFLPNEPVGNDQMEEVLGKVHGLPSRVRRIILRNNGILRRYYALDPQTGRLTHTNARMTAEAVRKLKPWPDFRLDEIECLACGTSSPDQIMPGHASMVQGELGIGPCEIASASGVCISGATSLKYAYMSVLSGLARNAVATGSELASTFVRARFHEGAGTPAEADLEAAPNLGFNAEFLRWMLSDGAGAVFLAPDPSPDQLSLRIEWIEELSFAGEQETCMYAGAVKDETGRLRGWREFDTPEEAVRANAFAIQQDVRLLNERIIEITVGRALSRIAEKRNLSPGDVDWYLPHYSSQYFRDKVFRKMREIGFEVPYEKWFSNLAETGNVGAGSIYIILDELFHSGRIQKGQKLLLFIPESGRFSVSYALLTAA